MGYAGIDMGVHGKTVFDWTRNLEYQDIHFDIVSAFWGGAMDWKNFLKNHTSMKRPSAVTKDIIRESANILFEYEILDASSSKPGKEYLYFIHNAEVRVVHTSAKHLGSPMFFDGGELYVGVFDGTDDDSFVSWVESDIQPRYRIWQEGVAARNPRWSGETYDQDELGAAFDFLIHNKDVRDMKVNEERVIKVLDDEEELIKRVI